MIAVVNNLKKHKVNELDHEILVKTAASKNLFGEDFDATTI